VDTYPPEALKALGQALQERRGTLGHATRKGFWEAVGRGLVTEKQLQRIENGVGAGRSGLGPWPPAKIALLEQLYRVAPGSIVRKLNGGELTPLPGTPGGRPLELNDGLTDEDRATLRLFREAILRVQGRPARGA
jgi:hypothetical protein